MATIHVSEADATRDFSGLLARARSGDEIVVESESKPVVIMRSAPHTPGRTLSEVIALAEERSRRLGYKPVMDADFSADMEEIIRNRKPRDTSAWD